MFEQLSPAAPADLAFLVGFAFIAGLARGFSGFGAALIFVPLASTVIGPKTAVPLLLVVDGILMTGMIPNALRWGDRPRVLVMAAGAVVGVPIGAWLLSRLDPLLIRWSIAALVLSLLALLVSGWRYHGQPRPPATALVGLVSGLLSGIAQVGGPPVVAYWLGGAIKPIVVRANIILYFAISTVLSAVSYVWGGLITAEVLALSLVVAPLYAFGLWLGSHMFGVAAEATFRRVCYLMIGASSILSLPILDGVLR